MNVEIVVRMAIKNVLKQKKKVKVIGFPSTRNSFNNR